LQNLEIVCFSGIYLGDASTALCVSKLIDMGVTAVVNVAQVSDVEHARKVEFGFTYKLF
jgi:hypothetical protein